MPTLSTKVGDTAVSAAQDRGHDALALQIARCRQFDDSSDGDDNDEDDDEDDDWYLSDGAVEGREVYYQALLKPNYFCKEATAGKFTSLHCTVTCQQMLWKYFGYI